MGGRGVMSDKKVKKSFVLYLDSLEVLDDMSPEEVACMFIAIRDYNKGLEPKLLPSLSFLFKQFSNQFDRDHGKWLKTCESRALAGSIGGKQKVANASKCKQKVASVAILADTDNVSENVSENEIDTESDISKRSPTGSEIAFECFWKSYPKKIGKQAARKAWSAKANKSKPSTAEIIKAVTTAKDSPQWAEASGRFIPNPATWLNRHGWDDEADTEKATGSYYDQNKVF
jgi:hypothetical protein